MLDVDIQNQIMSFQLKYHDKITSILTGSHINKFKLICQLRYIVSCLAYIAYPNVIPLLIALDARKQDDLSKISSNGARSIFVLPDLAGKTHLLIALSTVVFVVCREKGLAFGSNFHMLSLILFLNKGRS